jgi:hypothetical protein
LIYIADGKPVLVLLRGDQLNEAKLADALGTATFRPGRREIFKALGAMGSLGAVGVTGPRYADERCTTAQE